MTTSDPTPDSRQPEKNDGPKCGISFWTARLGHAYRCTQVLKARVSRCEKVCQSQAIQCRKVARERQKARAPTSITNTSMSRRRCILIPAESCPKEAARGAARDGPTVARRLHGHPQSRNAGTTAVAASALEMVSWSFLVFGGRRRYLFCSGMNCALRVNSCFRRVCRRGVNVDPVPCMLLGKKSQDDHGLFVVIILVVSTQAKHVNCVLR